MSFRDYTMVVLKGEDNLLELFPLRIQPEAESFLWMERIFHSLQFHQCGIM